jgi:hypothetical protein
VCWSLVTEAVLGSLAAWPEVMVLKGHQPLLALGKVAVRLPAGLAVGVALEVRAARPGAR